MTITSPLFEAYVKCPTKCWLKYAGESAAGSAYAAWVQAKNEACRVEGINRLVAEVPDAERVLSVTASPPTNLKTATWRLAADLPARVPTIATRIPIVERVPSAGRGKAAQFIPVRFAWANKVGRDDKLLLAFDARFGSDIEAKAGLSPRYNNRVPAPALLSEMQLDRAVRAWKGEQDGLGHQIHAALEQNAGSPATDSTATNV